MWTVSYTHLDVYKRQAEHRPRDACKRHADAVIGGALGFDDLVGGRAHFFSCLLYTSLAAGETYPGLLDSLITLALERAGGVHD